MKPDREVVEKWKRVLSPYFGPDNKRSLRQLVGTSILFLALWAGMLWSLQFSYWITLALSIPTAAILMRLFVIQHDCGHGSFFTSQRWANTVGMVLGILTLTPYHYWRKTHALHHAHSGDLDMRGFGDIDTITVTEYEALSGLNRLYYRVYRNPFVIFGPGALFHFVVKHRWPWDMPWAWKREWRSVWITNAALIGLVVAAHFTIGLKTFFLVQAPVTAVACALGVWLFYVQHQFEETYWYDHENWNYYDAGLHGSSYLVLPPLLQWLTASIGVHHVHHLSARIPNYRLQKAHDENKELWEVSRMSIKDGLKTLHLALWDEDTRKLISFGEYRRLKAARAS